MRHGPAEAGRRTSEISRGTYVFDFLTFGDDAHEREEGLIDQVERLLL